MYRNKIQHGVMLMARKSYKRDIEMLERLAKVSRQEVAKEFHLTLGGLNSWISRIRDRRKEVLWYGGMLASLERQSDRMQKILLSAKLEEAEEKVEPPPSITKAKKPEEKKVEPAPKVTEPKPFGQPEKVHCPHLKQEVSISKCEICKAQDWDKWLSCQDIQRGKTD